jgi:hypothetical protein
LARVPNLGDDHFFTISNLPIPPFDNHRRWGGAAALFCCTPALYGAGCSRVRKLLHASIIRLVPPKKKALGKSVRSTGLPGVVVFPARLQPG